MSAPIDELAPNPRQPRREFEDEALQELATSIRAVGLLQPIVVRQIEHGRYEIIAGERRWRAARMAGLDEVPIMVRVSDASESLQLALIENIQRQDISPLECAEAYRALVSEFGLTQEDIAERVGKSRSSITNVMRLLRLPEEIRRALASGVISEGHARALLQFETETEQLVVFRRVLEKGLSVRDVERIARGEMRTKAQTSTTAAVSMGVMRDPLETAISEFFGAPVSISRSGKGGKVQIEFFSEDDLSRIAERLGITLR
jgi:ParB family chromosome partitioning protein